MRRIQYRWRRLLAVSAALMGVAALIVSSPSSYEEVYEPASAEAHAESQLDSETSDDQLLASTVLEKLEIKGRAPKTGYERSEQFYKTWPSVDGCSLRQRIIKREMGETAQLAEDQCTVISGEFDEPYTGQHLIFYTKSDFSKGIQIDHIVALSDAWQKGAQQLTQEERYSLATDPLNLIAADASANQQKSDGDAATWLPKNKAFRCQYVARQISVKYKYGLWVTQAEHDAMRRVLETCPQEQAVGLEN